VARRVATLHVGQLLLLVDVDEDVPPDGLEESGTLDLARLKNHVPVREDDDRPPLPAMLYHVERVREEPVREGVFDEVGRDGEQVRVVGVLDAVALEGAEVVGVAQFGAQLFEDDPVAPGALAPYLALQEAPEVAGDPVVVEQGVVHVEEEDHVARPHQKSLQVRPAPSAAPFKPHPHHKERRRLRLAHLSLAANRRLEIRLNA
jgi:hypothetical protein